ncbi:MAG: type III-A CRISPR-associated RAMP protein Csm3 [Candidatus Hydrogenedentes bacterium]|nr:type III-A CRISPR-associated RAMP protein Csm3 [Candidatus Hydrogenedentota bacterium]
MKKLIKHVEVLGVLRVVTGLRIGAGGASIEIGGLDNPILRHPLSKVPYVPGSSLKGKLRSLLEVNKFKLGRYSEPQGGICACGRCVVCWLFGCGRAQDATEPTRLIFRDCPIRKEDELRLKELLSDGVFYSEVKSEVTMDRATGKVGGGGPRNMDRIMAGTRLDFRLTIRVLEGDNENEMKEVLLHAFRILEKEGLGGSVSRGYGQVAFEDLSWDGEDISRLLHPESVKV